MPPEAVRTPDTLDLPRSLYAETAREPAATPPLPGDRRVKVAVIGGGFTGLSAALHLAQGGIEAMVIEAGEPGWGASGRNGGQVNPGLKTEPDQILRDFGPGLGDRMIALSGNAPQKVFDLIREHQIRCEADRGGTIRAAFTRRAADILERATEALRRRGLPVTALDRDRIAAATGSERYVFGALDARGGSVNPLGFARGLADAAIRAGAVIHGQTRALRLDPEGCGWRITTTRGHVGADWLVLATNGYTDDLWPPLRRSVVPVFSGIVSSEPLLEATARRILPGRAVLYEHEAITVYYRIDAANRLLMGGRSRQHPVEGPSAMPDLKAYARRLWPFVDEFRWTHGWNGQLAITADHYPHLHEPVPQVIAALGYNGRGIAMATAMGGEIARRVAGTPAEALDMPVTGITPIRFHRWWRVGVAARIAYGRARTTLRI